MSDEPWTPDEALVDVVKVRRVDIKALSGPDRAWVVASLSIAGWTGPAMAEQLRCSLRLIQQIKTEPMTQVALYTLRLREDMRRAEDMHAAETYVLAADLAKKDREITRLIGHRNVMCERLVLLQRQANGGQVHGVPEPVRVHERKRARRRAA